jgi:CspA family cold shock protein
VLFIYKTKKREGEVMETKTGTIITMRKDKGYGFVKPDEESVNLFFHTSRVLSPEYESLNIGDRVEYLEEDVARGKQAVDIAVI